jgi:hypothetical protein
MRLLGLTAAMCMALTGCATPEALTKDQVRENITVHSGYPGCTSCYKVKTFTSPTLAKLSSHVSEGAQQGWLNAKVQLIITNNTEGNFPEYRLQLEMVNNGLFSSGVKVRFRDLHGLKEALSPVDDFDEKRCFSKLGSGCSWTQTVKLPTQTVQNALADNVSLDFFVGVNVASSVKSNDGFRLVIKASNESVGKNFTISSESLMGFVEGVQLAGGTLPTEKREVSGRGD